MISKSEIEANNDFQPLLAIDMDVEVFASRWSNCDRLSSYVARMVSHNRTDSLLYSNLFSSAFNELLETAFRYHGESGRFLCEIHRAGPTDRIALSIPGSQDDFELYEKAVRQAGGDDAAKLYRDALFSGDEPDPIVGLLELGVDYKAALSLERLDGKGLMLVVDLRLEDPES